MDDGGHDQLSLFALRLVSHHKRVSLLRRILSFHKTRNPKHYIDLRSSSKLFHRALPQQPPLWTSYPHSNHATLQSLLDRLEQLYTSPHSGNMPSLLFIEEGKHCAEEKYVKVKIPISIYGAGREKTTLVGVGLQIQGEKSDGIVEIEDLTIQGGKGCGLWVWKGMSLVAKRCSIVACQEEGVFAWEVDVTCDDLQVVGCGQSGVSAGIGVTVTLSGEDTQIQGNVTKGFSIDCGLYTYSPTSKIQLVAPLTKEEISTNNGGGGNWGGHGIIEQVGNDGVVLQILYEGQKD